ncbi:MGH1-like glycoside hydrolase domain-containing protein [Petrocella sp. FN5]|uniref:MGH1-like glycoside hydrolase domain-containing protein n=1 Tax=Petrocella sp. FN5 TaxID=3032002 RepID=UPI0023DC4773|nr:glucosidase [Petrocella sp. FN5]MDF1618422.1 glucosidase [Petrocella sp. FN5]
MTKDNQELVRLRENKEHKQFWRLWGPYLSERQWGTVREDYSPDGEAWSYFPHDHARSRVYRWGEDGLAGISEISQNLCFSVALWNGKDSILKERLFGLSGTEGNHGEDVKELYYYLDNTPTHSYMKYLYKYPQNEFPYEELIVKNAQNSKMSPEYELLNTACFREGKYFDVFVEYAKKTPRDISIKITIYNRGDEEAFIDVLPTLWFRNTWSFGGSHEKPSIVCAKSNGVSYLEAAHKIIGKYYLYFQEEKSVLFTENETNYQRIFQHQNKSPYVKDAFHQVVVSKDEELLRGKTVGTKAALRYSFKIEPKGKQEILLRLSEEFSKANPIEECETILARQKEEADQFYESLENQNIDPEVSNIKRQAYAGLLWSKQYYNYEVETWLKGDEQTVNKDDPRKNGRNANWKHLFNRDIISMPDKWEYPWYATWDIAFHCIPFANIDPDFAKKQLLLFLREWYMHPNGQLPAYEWALSDVNPPVHAWACYQVYSIEKKKTGKGDLNFLKSAFHKLLLNFTWWVNRMDADGMNVFQGGFLGLDNISLFDRSKPIPTGGHLEQADGTSWMAMYALNMMTIALELSTVDLTYEDMASKFFEHFVHIAEAFNNYGSELGIQLWDEEDGFYYDAIHYNDNSVKTIKVKSIVGLIPLFATVSFDVKFLEQFTEFSKRLKWFRNNRVSLGKQIIVNQVEGEEKILFSLVNKERLYRILEKLLDEKEFLSTIGIRSLSKYHEGHPFILESNNESYCINYQPGESESYLFGGNSNWRGPIWFPINYLLIDALKMDYCYYGEHFKVEFPTGSNNWITLREVAGELSKRLANIFIPDQEGKRIVHGDENIYQENPNFKDLILFYEYFHGCTGKGLGASHQTGWTALIASLI